MTNEQNLPADLNEASEGETHFLSVEEQLEEVRAQQARMAQQLDVIIGLVKSQVSPEAAEASRVHETTMTEHLEEIRRLADLTQRSSNNVKMLVRSQRDDVAGLMSRLLAARTSPGFADAFEDPNPLVTVRIASYQSTDDLVGIALPSVLSQSHQNLEVLVVNDGPNPETASAIRELGDPRVVYSEFLHRSIYPEDAARRWFVAGSPGMNEGIRRARGLWIAPLDEDDEFTENHIERLLLLAREHKAELAYGALIQKDLIEGGEERIFAYPPERGGFSFQGAIVHGMLSFFEYDQESWLVSEPGDWNLARRMLASGVRVAGVDEIVGTLNRVPYTHKNVQPGR